MKTGNDETDVVGKATSSWASSMDSLELCAKFCVYVSWAWGKTIGFIPQHMGSLAQQRLRTTAEGYAGQWAASLLGGGRV